MLKKSEEILSSHNLKSTACRKLIVSELLASKTAMTEQEIKQNSGELFDRVTFYRTLKTLEETGIIHSIVVNNNLVKYAISSSDCSEIHSHFYCVKCNEVHCLDNAINVSLNLPKGFIVKNLDIIINGICSHCN